MTKKNIQVRYFAALRDHAGIRGESVEFTGESAKDLYQQLKHLHGFSLCVSHLRVAVNDSFESLEITLQDGDSVVFMPPVSGG